MAIPIIIAIVAAALIASPVAVDIGMGHTITPDHPLFQVEQLGEQMRLSVGNIGHGELFQERVEEFKSLNWTNPDKIKALETSLDAVNEEMRAYTEGMEMNESNWYQVMNQYQQMLQEIMQAHEVPQQVRELLADWQNRNNNEFGGH